MMKLDNRLPQEVENLVITVCTHCTVEKQEPPHLIIPINRGNGRTAITQNIAARYRDAAVRSFSSRESYLEYKLTGTNANIDEIFIDIQENCEYSNDYHGIIALDIDDLLPKFNETVGNKFFDIINKIKHHATLIIFIPSDCQKSKIDSLLNKIGVNCQLLMPGIHKKDKVSEVSL